MPNPASDEKGNLVKNNDNRTNTIGISKVIHGLLQNRGSRLLITDQHISRKSFAVDFP